MEEDWRVEWAALRSGTARLDSAIGQRDWTARLDSEFGKQLWQRQLAREIFNEAR
jgi:hypothetical protein